jgi:hypothetical protein
MRCAYNEQFLFVEHSSQEVILLFEESHELRRRVNRSVNWAAKLGFGPFQSRRKLLEADLGKDKEIHVARRAFLPTGDRAIDEAHLNSRAIALQFLAKDIDQPHGLRDQALEFRQERAVFIRLEVNAVAVFPAAKYPRLHQLRERFLETRRRAPQLLGQIAEIPSPVRSHAGRSQEPLHGAGHKRVEG